MSMKKLIVLIINSCRYAHNIMMFTSYFFQSTSGRRQFLLNQMLVHMWVRHLMYVCQYSHVLCMCVRACVCCVQQNSCNWDQVGSTGWGSLPLAVQLPLLCDAGCTVLLLELPNMANTFSTVHAPYPMSCQTYILSLLLHFQCIFVGEKNLVNLSF